MDKNSDYLKLYVLYLKISYLESCICNSSKLYVWQDSSGFCIHMQAHTHWGGRKGEKSLPRAGICGRETRLQANCSHLVWDKQPGSEALLWLSHVEWWCKLVTSLLLAFSAGALRLKLWEMQLPLYNITVKVTPTTANLLQNQLFKVMLNLI